MRVEPWPSISHSEPKSCRSLKTKKFMRNSLILSKLCRFQQTSMETTYACTVASRLNWRVNRISIPLTDLLSLHFMDSSVICFGPIQWKIAKPASFVSARMSNESALSNLDWTQSKRSCDRITSFRSFAPIKFRLMATKCTVGADIRLSLL